MDVEALAGRIADLEDSDELQAGEIGGLAIELAALQVRLAAIEALPGIASKLAK